MKITTGRSWNRKPPGKFLHSRAAPQCEAARPPQFASVLVERIIVETANHLISAQAATTLKKQKKTGVARGYLKAENRTRALTKS
jgi:hypothetical protein